tara:strand:+ start:12692 stop:13252 length:561 start_codon:yes stop_codon:yes gene_type:complete
MFTIITPALKGRYSDLLSKIFATRQSFVPDKEVDFDTESSLYLAYEDKVHGIFASCRLNRLCDSPAASFYKTHFSDEEFKSLREVSLVSFHMEDDHWAQTNPGSFDYAIRHFYRDLQEALINLSLAHHFSGIVSLSDKEDHNDFTFFGDWFFHKNHLLTLLGEQYVVGELAIDPDLFRDFKTGEAA